MVRVLTLLLFSMLAFSTVIYALESSMPTPTAPQSSADELLAFAPEVDRLPATTAPFDETPITPVESTGSPMWP